MKNAFDTLIIGAGAAALKCADELLRTGRKSVCIAADDVMDGTSRNAGSDKQTYYKLTLSGGDGDSVREMAKNLFDGGCVDGPNALAEASLSAKCFLRLCDLGVPFPMNRYGEYIGYKTDHDQRRRATSCGPLTSRKMTEALEKNMRKNGAVILDGHMAVRILVRENTARGVVFYEKDSRELKTVYCNHLVWATGGPADVYYHVSYPLKHHGMSGAMFLAGAAGCNLTEWQNGLGSVNPRWNVSGTYMQALPRFVSVNPDGTDEREFLLDGFSDLSDMLSSVFLKGYQWPFDARKAFDGSSRVDLLVQAEIRKGRRVYLDFRSNPEKDRFEFSLLSKEAYDYLKNAGAFLPTPIERLGHMNQPAVDFYKSKGVDLHKEMLEIALCAQHMNGGVMVNEWWETNISRLYCIGEAAGTHGVYRPGGSALNAGQAGAERAARKITRTEEATPQNTYNPAEIDEVKNLIDGCLSSFSNLERIKNEEALTMSQVAAAIREKSALEPFMQHTKELINTFKETVRISSMDEADQLLRFYDTLVSRVMILKAMTEYVNQGGVNRGSGLYTQNGVPEKNSPSDPNRDRIQMVYYNRGQPYTAVRSVYPIPEDDDFFENVWRDFRLNQW